MKILLVEDDPSLREGMLEALEELAEVHATSSVAGALDALAANRFALVMADLHIGDAQGGGREILIAARERLEVALTAYTGALLVVSHDRYLLDRLVDHLLVLGSEQPIRFPGRYSEWEERQNQ